MSKNQDPKQQIIDHLSGIERSLRWLAIKADIPYGTLYGIIYQGTMDLTEDRLSAINNVLGTDFKLPE